jgi:hypothetical protein
MRGAERPAKVAWTHPFLLPLMPLSDYAAAQTFIDIMDISQGEQDIKELLSFTDNMPLAVDLIAHLAEYEGCGNVLARWKTEKTTLLSTGKDRKSNLDVSIRLSLSGPQMTFGAKDLLSLLSILPDGLPDAELLQTFLPIKDIRSCKAALLSTSLAYIDKKRLRSLTPIREHIRQFSPPSQLLVYPLQNHFRSVLDLYLKYTGEHLQSIIDQITLNLGNLQQLLDLGLHTDHPDVGSIIHCIIKLNSFHRVTGRRGVRLMEQIPAILSQFRDQSLELHFISEVLRSTRFYPILDP